MAGTMNLGLDISGDPGHPRVARVYLDLACSYLKGQGAATLTADCASIADFEREIVRLKEECDELLERAREELGDPTPRSADAGEAGSPKTSQVPHPVDKIRLKIEDDLRVEDEMTREVETVHRNDNLSMVDELMRIGGFRHVLVVEDDDSEAVAGVVSHRDIFFGALAWSTGQGETAHHKVLDTMPVKNVMSGEVTTVSPDTPLADAARIMLEKKIGCLAVVRNERIVGILTEGDFLSMLTSADYGETEQTAAGPA
jgi:CBS domain-containing protein